jgi:Creatinine amidohydrolase
MAYHIHETGYHAPWLKEVMGGINPRLGALPPHLVLETLLYQLREFYNAGFGGAVVISGHHGAQNDLRMIGEAFSASFEFSAFVRTDPELVAGAHIGDHAGQYEISQLLAIRPDLVSLKRADRVGSDPLGRFAQNPTQSTPRQNRGARFLSSASVRSRKSCGAWFSSNLPVSSQWISSMRFGDPSLLRSTAGRPSIRSASSYRVPSRIVEASERLPRVPMGRLKANVLRDDPVTFAMVEDDVFEDSADDVRCTGHGADESAAPDVRVTPLVLVGRKSTSVSEPFV